MGDPDVVVLSSPVHLDPADVILFDNSLGATALILGASLRRTGGVRQLTVPQFARGIMRGSQYSRFIGLAPLPAVAPPYYFSLEVSDSWLKAADGGQVVQDDTDGLPLFAPLDAVAESFFSPPAGHTWRIESIRNGPSAGVAGAIEGYLDAAEGNEFFEKPLAAVDTEYVAAPFELTFPGQIAVDVTGGGVAGTRLQISGRRVA